MQCSTTRSAKKWDLPDALPPFAPLYLDGANSGTAHLGVGRFNPFDAENVGASGETTGAGRLGFSIRVDNGSGDRQRRSAGATDLVRLGVFQTQVSGNNIRIQ